MSTKGLITKEDQSKIKLILDALEADPKCYIFLEPVDHVGLGLDDYLDIVKNPMDMSTIRNKLNNNKYNTIQDVISDLNLIWFNCKLYNQQGSDIYNMAISMEKLCKRLLDKHFKEKKKPEKSAKKETQNEAKEDQNEATEQSEVQAKPVVKNTSQAAPEE